MRIVAAIAAIAIGWGLAAGCGSDADEPETRDRPASPAAEETAPSGEAGPTGVRAKSCGEGMLALRAVNEGCAVAREIAAGWRARESCSQPQGDSRFSCTVGDYRCLGVVVGRGIAVSCARPGRSVSFIAERAS